VLAVPRQVILTPQEMSMGAKCGATRQIASLMKGSLDAYGCTEEYGWNQHIEGACGEIGASKLTHRYWEPTVNTYGSEPDIQPNINVRTRSRHDYELIIRPKDNPAFPVILVTGTAPVFIVRGYFIAGDAHRDEWWHDYGQRNSPAWFVPQRELRDISDLIVED
jgi:hypothetical protein